MAVEIPIITGDPLKKEDGATFTCFVLPFRYHPVCAEAYDTLMVEVGESPCYTRTNMRSREWVSRMRYFTSETAKVLFEHAQWLELSKCYWEKLNYPKLFDFHTNGKQKRKMTVRLHPPRLALFEWHELTVNHNPKNQDIFHTGFLVLEASFLGGDAYTTAPTYSDLLQFNELFRYWRVPFDGHKAILKGALGSSFGEKPEEYYFQRWAKLLQIPLKISSNKKLYYLFPGKWEPAAKSWWRVEVNEQALSPHNNAQMDDSGWICYADTRAFVWSCAVINGGARTLVHMGCEEAADIESPVNLGGWIKFLNVDPPGDITCMNKATEYEKDWAKDRYYDRWLNYGTLYGFNYHAGVMLAKPSKEPPVVRYFHDLYFDMTLLMLYLRITLFRFSRELTCLSTDMRSNTGSFRKYRKKFKTLRREFAVFTNLYQFPLISNQQQAIEMYALIRKRMDVQELFKEVEEEIKSSHEYFQFEEESYLNKYIFWLTVLGIPIALIGTVATILSIKEVMDYLIKFFPIF